MFSSMFRVLNENAGFAALDFTKVGADRYLLIPCVLFFTFVMYAVKRFIQNKNAIIKKRVYICISGLLIVIALTSFSLFWPFENISYKSDIRSMYYPAQKGEVITIPINPKEWTMTLIKK